MAEKSADFSGVVHCDDLELGELVEIAECVDRFHGHDVPSGGYTLGTAFCAVLNGGTAEEIQSALAIVSGWSLEPLGGWVPERREPNE